MSRRREIAVVGGGPAGLMAAEIAAATGAAVTVYDRMPSVGRKFLLAGRGGLNLTHAELFAAFAARYGAARASLRPALDAFGPGDLRVWADGLGGETFVGSSGRVFPRAWKASPLLRAWLARLDGGGVAFRLRHRWTGFGPEGALGFEAPDGPVSVRPDAAILALGGGSWPRLGSDGSWTEPLGAAGIRVLPLRPANAGLAVPWSEGFRARFAGEPLKRIALGHGGEVVRGDAVVTAAGLEGGAVYPLSAAVGAALARGGDAVLSVDLRPDLDGPALAGKLARPRSRASGSTFLRKAAGLAPVAIGLLHESVGRDVPTDPNRLSGLIKDVPLRPSGTDAIARAISSAGGIALDELDARSMLRRRPGVFVAGEMLDWDAPTGGYLLTASMATGAAAGRGACEWLDDTTSP